MSEQVTKAMSGVESVQEARKELVSKCGRKCDTYPVYIEQNLHKDSVNRKCIPQKSTKGKNPTGKDLRAILVVALSTSANNKEENNKADTDITERTPKQRKTTSHLCRNTPKRNV